MNAAEGSSDKKAAESSEALQFRQVDELDLCYGQAMALIKLLHNENLPKDFKCSKRNSYATFAKARDHKRKILCRFLSIGAQHKSKLTVTASDDSIKHKWTILANHKKLINF